MLETIYRFDPMITNVGIVALEKNQINHHIYSRPIAIFGIIIIILIIIIIITRYEDIPVEMTGTDCPRAIDGFDDVNLTNIVKTNIELAHYAQVMMKKLKRFLVSNELYPLAHSSSEELNSSNSGR